MLPDHSLHCALSNCTLTRDMAIAVMLAQLSAGHMMSSFFLKMYNLPASCVLQLKHVRCEFFISHTLYSVTIMLGLYPLIIYVIK